MKYAGAIALIFIVFAIMVSCTYSNEELVEASIQLVPTSIAQPELVESTLIECNGIHSVELSAIDNILQITYNKARVSLEDLNYILVSLGYQPIPARRQIIQAGM